MVVMRYDTKASLVPSFSLMGVPTTQSSVSGPRPCALCARLVPAPSMLCPGSSAAGAERDVCSWTCSLQETLEKSSWSMTAMSRESREESGCLGGWVWSVLSCDVGAGVWVVVRSEAGQFEWRG